MLFVLGLIVLASLFAGTLPAMHAARVSAGAALKDDSRSSTSARLGRFSSGLVVAELAVSCGLLIAAGLMIKSVVQLKNVPMPFAIDNVLTARVDLPRADYPDSAASIRFFEQLLPRLRAVPGVEAATLSDGLPAAGNGIDPRADRRQGLPARTATIRWRAKASSRPATSTRSRRRSSRGREFTTGRRRRRVQPVAIINESFARLHFPGHRSVGRQLQAHPPGAKEPWLTDRRRRAGPDDGRHRQQQRQPGRLLHPDRAERCRQRRPHCGAHARRAGARSRRWFVRRRVARSGPGDLRDRHDAARHRSADLVLHRLRHVLHGVRLLRAVVSRPRGSTA